MTYAVFLGVFLLLPIVLLAVAVGRRWRRRHGGACLLVCGLAFLYTSPWDNHAAKVGLWSFDRQFAPPSHFILYLPWEEYAFYGLQGVLLCLGMVGLSQVLKPKDGGEL